VIGLDDVPEAGDIFNVVDSLENAQNLSNERKEKKKPTSGKREQLTLENVFDKMKEKDEVKIIIKTDVHGSREAILKSISGLDQKTVSVKVIHSGVGNVSESDILLADASKAIIMSFNAASEERASTLANERSVQIKKYNIIYELLDDVKLLMEGKLEPEKVTEVIGTCEVKATFKISRIGTIAGCSVTNGRVERSSQVRVIRDRKEVFSGRIASLKRFKDDVKEVQKGYECGIRMEGFDDVRAGDVIEAFVVKQVARKLAGSVE
jgi:translation initiation factor IF-2